MARTRTGSPKVYQLKVTLRGVRPPVWRRIQVAGDSRLDELHHILQVAMGWTNSHLHQFRIGDTDYSDPDSGLEQAESTRRVRLDQVVSGQKDRFVYEYDFGDGWEHEVLVEKVLEREVQRRYPVCITGRRACPPEDCGGAWGYAQLLEAIRDPEHPEHGEMLEWVGEEFDPEEFDAEAVNRFLGR
ncbi:MAG: plasmid pRiA4b ORF-3 family protein [Candidatus Latescibacterota bacterium]